MSRIKEDMREDKREDKRRPVKLIIAAALWLIVWQTASVLTGLDLILASPVAVLLSLKSMLAVTSTYAILLRTFVRITVGFLCAFVFGSVCACAAHRFDFVRILLVPPVMLMKSLPMASFIILLLIWFGSAKVSSLTSFIVTFPLIYSGVMSGISNRDMKLLEMSHVFGISTLRRIRWIDIPTVISIAKPDIRMAAGMCLKAGVSAEVIGLARLTVGEQLYYSKIYLATADLFAWSLLVVLLGFLWEKAFVLVVELAVKRLKRL